MVLVLSAIGHYSNADSFTDFDGTKKNRRKAVALASGAQSLLFCWFEERVKLFAGSHPADDVAHHHGQHHGAKEYGHASQYLREGFAEAGQSPQSFAEENQADRHQDEMVFLVFTDKYIAGEEAKDDHYPGHPFVQVGNQTDNNGQGQADNERPTCNCSLIHRSSFRRLRRLFGWHGKTL